MTAQLFKCFTYLTLTKQFSQSTTRFLFHLLQCFCKEQRDEIHPSALSERADASSFSRAVTCGIMRRVVPLRGSSEDPLRLMAGTDYLRADMRSTNTHSILSTTAGLPAARACGCQGTGGPKPHPRGDVHVEESVFPVCWFPSSCLTPA